MPNINDVIVIDGPGNGRGSISLQERLAAGEMTEADLAEAEERIKHGEYLFPTKTTTIATGETVTTIGTCGDGRSAADQDATQAQMFGGVPAFAKDAYLAGMTRYSEPNEPLLSGMKQLMHERSQQGLPNSNHVDDHASGDKSGCGEQDGAPGAFSLIVEDGETVRATVNALAAAFNLSVTAEQFKRIQDRARTVLDRDLLPTGAQVRDALIESDGEQAVEQLESDHNEVFYILDAVDGHTFNRQQFYDDWDAKGIQAFHEDVDVILGDLKRMSQSDEELSELVAANLVRRVATALNLTKNDLRIIILK